MEGLLPEAVTTVAKADLEPFANGKRVGSYLFGRTIGEGSFAKVKEALHVSTGEKVAIKIINKKKAREDRYVSRNLKREAELMQKVRHQNVVRLLEVMETDSFYYLVTELCCGGELLDVICERKCLDEKISRKFVAQLISAVYSMHLNGVVHRDLKIENFLLDEQDDLKIVDFGLSNVLPNAGLEAWEQTGMCPLLLTTHCGSPAYAAPELLAQKPYGAQIDIWSIGVNMFAMLTGSLPYNLERFNIIDMYHKMMERKMMPFPSHVSRDARDLIIQLLDPVPETRITLKEAINHPWLRPARKYLLNCESATAKPLIEVNQNIVLHMADNMGMSMKEVVNSVKQNRASHSFAIYFLLNEKLRRFERRKRGDVAGESTFAKVKVVKKATLNPDISPKNKFTYKGVKIRRGSSSHHSFHENGSDGARSDGDSDPDTLKPLENADRWNQYATFPRDRRTSYPDASKINENRLVHATLDKGSDDIDYRHISSPETTDNSASSLESTQILRKKLINVETRDLSIPKSRTRKESGSDEEIFARSRSKSLTGREEYDYIQNISAGDGRHRASTTGTSFHHMDIKPVKLSLPIKLKALLHRNATDFREVNIPENGANQFFENRESEVIIEGERTHMMTDRAEKEEYENRVSLNDAANNSPRKNHVLKLNNSIDENQHSLLNAVADNITEIIPPPIPFSDQGLKMNVEVVEPRFIKSLSSNKEKQVVKRPEMKTISTGSFAKTTGSRKGQRGSSERSKSFSEWKSNAFRHTQFKRIELEKVKRIELEPFQKTLVQVSPGLQTVSSYSLQLVKHELFDGNMVRGETHAENESGFDLNNNSHPKRFQNREGRRSKAILCDASRREATPDGEKRFQSASRTEKKQQELTQFEGGHRSIAFVEKRSEIDEFRKNGQKANAFESIQLEDNRFDEKGLEANPFRVNVVKLAKCQCIPVLRPRIVEPDKLVICSKGTTSGRSVTKNEKNPHSSNKDAKSHRRTNFQLDGGSESSLSDRRTVPDKSKEREGTSLVNFRPLSSNNLTERRDKNRSRSLNEFDIVARSEHLQTSTRSKQRARTRTSSGGEHGRPRNSSPRIGSDQSLRNSQSCREGDKHTSLKR